MMTITISTCHPVNSIKAMTEIRSLWLTENI